MLIRREEHNIDKTFRKKLYDAQEEVPLHLWEGIRTKTDNRRSPIFWWFIASMAVSVACVTALVMVQTNSPESGSEKVLLSEMNKNDGENSSEKQDEITSTYKPSSTSEMATDMVMPANNLKEDAASLPDLEIEKSRTNSISNSKQLSIPAVTDETNTNAVNGNLFPSLNAMELENLISLNPLSEQVVTVDSDNRITTESVSTSTIEASILDDSNLPYYSAAMTPSPVNHNGRLMFGMYYSIGNPVRIAAPGANKPELNQLTSRSEFGRSTSYGITAGYAIYKGLYILSGVESSSFKENHSWYDSTRTDIMTFTESLVPTFPDGDTIPVYVTNIDTIQNSDIEVCKSSHVNRYSSVNIPLLAGYRFSLNNRFAILAEAGPVFRFERSQVGSFVFSDGYQPRSQANYATADVIQSQLDYVYLNDYYAQWKTDMHLGLSLSVNLAKGWSLNTGAQCRWMLNKSDEIKPLSHRIVQPGIRVGLLCRF